MRRELFAPCRFNALQALLGDRIKLMSDGVDVPKGGAVLGRQFPDSRKQRSRNLNKVQISLRPWCNVRRETAATVLDVLSRAHHDPVARQVENVAKEFILVDGGIGDTLRSLSLFGAAIGRWEPREPLVEQVLLLCPSCEPQPGS